MVPGPQSLCVELANANQKNEVGAWRRMPGMGFRLSHDGAGPVWEERSSPWTVQPESWGCLYNLCYSRRRWLFLDRGHRKSLFQKPLFRTCVRDRTGAGVEILQTQTTAMFTISLVPLLSPWKTSWLVWGSRISRRLGVRLFLNGGKTTWRSKSPHHAERFRGLAPEKDLSC